MLAYDPSTNPLNNNEWAFPLTECFHVASMALAIGSVAMVDFRLLGFGMANQTAAQVVRDTELWTLAGLTVVVTSGFLIFSSDPVHYLNNGPFQFKMGALVLAILFNYTVHRWVAQRGAASVYRFPVAGLSLVLWLSLVFAGVFTAFV